MARPGSQITLVGIRMFEALAHEHGHHNTPRGVHLDHLARVIWAGTPVADWRAQFRVQYAVLSQTARLAHMSIMCSQSRYHFGNYSAQCVDRMRSNMILHIIRHKTFDLETTDTSVLSWIDGQHELLLAAVPQRRRNAWGFASNYLIDDYIP